jgi:uncharacterized protein (TIGR03437 family)
VRVGENLPLELIAEIFDPFGNRLVNLPVTWEIVTPNTLALVGPTSVTDGNGRARTRVRAGSIPGSHQLRLRVGQQQALFTVNVASNVGSVAIDSGNNQTGVVTGQPFPQPLVVRVLDTSNQPINGQIVNWAITGGAGVLSTATSLTGADGRASVNVTAGGVAGSITIVATVAQQAPVAFTLTSRLPGPSLTATSFRNEASGQIGITPGGLVRMTGLGLAPTLNGEVNASLLKGVLPFELANVRVEFTSGSWSGFAPIYQVARVSGVESVLLQVPFDLPLGQNASAVVTVSGGSSTVTGIPVLIASPGILEDNFPTGRRAVVIRSDGLVVTPETPARRGETLRVYAIGLGQTTPLAETNRVGMPDQFVKAAIAVGIDDQGVEVISAKMAENLIGVYEVIFVVPTTATFGNNRPLGFVMEVNPGQPLYANGSVIAIGPQ